MWQKYKQSHSPNTKSARLTIENAQVLSRAEGPSESLKTREMFSSFVNNTILDLGPLQKSPENFQAPKSFVKL